MTKQILKTKSKTYEIIWHDSTDFSKIKPVTQVYGICFTQDGKICIIRNKGGVGKMMTEGHWSLPDGTPEKNETFKQTLIREVDEEADINIQHLTRLGYQTVQDKKTKKKIYQLRYTAIISKITKQTMDPAEKIILERKFIKQENFLKYVKWGNTGKFMIAKAIKWFESKKC